MAEVANLAGLTLASMLLNVAFVYHKPWFAVAAGVAFGLMLWRMNG